MKSKNVKKFFKEHKKTIIKTVVFMTVPTVVVVGCVVLNKILDRYVDDVCKRLDNE